MRGTRVLTGALAVMLLAVMLFAGCGGQPFPTAAPAPSGNSAAVGVTVHLSSDPRLAPVDRLLSASKDQFNAGLFLSAFDDSAQPCNVVSIAQRIDGAPVSPPVDVSTVHLVSVRSHGATGAVEIADPQPYYLRLRHSNGEWVVDENACLWIGEVKGGQLPASITTGSNPLSATDPRRVPAAELINSLTNRFHAATFLAAFDLAEQPCDARALAGEVGNQSPTGTTQLAPQYFVRPIGPQQDGVLVRSGFGALALRIRLIDGHWRLDENACTWLVSFTSGRAAGDDRTVESDLRNALTAEKTVYTDNQTYNASPAFMKQIEPTLDWGHALKIYVADAVRPGDRNVVCMSETSDSGKTLAIADVAAGPHAGTYYSSTACPVPLTAATAANLDGSFDPGE